MDRNIETYSSRYGRSVMDSGFGPATAVKPLADVTDMHSSVDPNRRSVILDSHEQPFQSRKSLIEMADDKTTTPVTVSRGFAALASLTIAAAGALAGVWIYSLTGAMSYQTVVNRVGTVETRVEKMENAIQDLQGLKITANNLTNDVKSIKEKQADAEPDRKKMMSDISDIRILLAQKGMEPHQ